MPSLVTLAFLVWLALRCAAMAGVVLAPGWVCVKLFGPRCGLALYGLLLLVACGLTLAR